MATATRKPTKRTPPSAGGIEASNEAKGFARALKAPCGFFFPTIGEGVVRIPRLPPNGIQQRRAFAWAFLDAERTAQAICATNPKCPNAQFWALHPPNPPGGTGFFWR